MYLDITFQVLDSGVGINWGRFRYQLGKIQCNYWRQMHLVYIACSKCVVNLTIMFFNNSENYSQIKEKLKKNTKWVSNETIIAEFLLFYNHKLSMLL